MAIARCIGFLGADWWGSDARAMAMEFRRQGCILLERHYEDYFSTRLRGPGSRLVRRLTRPLVVREYNRAVLELLAVEALDFLLVFKGMLLQPSTLKKFAERGLPSYLVYPDVSFHDHGHNISACLPLYDAVFTTKSFHLDDHEVKRKAKDLRLIRHGFDPEVHRPVAFSEDLAEEYGCDVSFVGNWSAKKEQLLAAVVRHFPDIKLRVWGPNWARAQMDIRRRWSGRGAYGDELAAIYSYSRINLGLLSEAGTGNTRGDQLTARSWQIPASGGLLLHEDTAEIRQFFVPGREMAVFSDSDDLVRKIQELLNDEQVCQAMRRAGQERCRSSAYTYAPAVAAVLAYDSGRRGASAQPGPVT